MKQFHNFINGEFVATGKTFENRAPVNNSVIGLVHEAGRAEIDAAVQAARNALNGEWGKMSVVKRVDLLYAVADEITVLTNFWQQNWPIPASHIHWPRISTSRAARLISRCLRTSSRTRPPKVFR